MFETHQTMFKAKKQCFRDSERVSPPLFRLFRGFYGYTPRDTRAFNPRFTRTSTGRNPLASGGRSEL